MKTLITGAAGFVGAAVLRELLKKGHKVKALVRQSSVLDNLKNLDVEIVQGDLKDRSSLKKSLKDCKYLFHVAADYRLWVPKPEEIYQNNVIGTENLMEEVLNSEIEKVVYTSSSSVYGNNKSCVEADLPKPLSLHATLKLANEKLVSQFCLAEGVDYTIARVFNMYGGYDEFSIVSKIIKAYKNHQNIIQPYRFADAGTGIAGWEYIDKDTATGSTDELTVSSLPDYPYFMYLFYEVRGDGDTMTEIRFGIDGAIKTGNNYSERASYNAGAQQTAIDQSSIFLQKLTIQSFLTIAVKS